MVRIGKKMTGHVEHAQKKPRVEKHPSKAVKGLSTKVENLIKKVDLTAGNPPNYSTKKPRMSKQIEKAAQKTLEKLGM